MQHAHTVPIIFSNNGEQNTRTEQNKGKAPLGKAVTRLWRFLTCLQRGLLWCSESSQTVTYSPENNCLTCSWAHSLPCRQHRVELELFFVQNVLLFYKLSCLTLLVFVHVGVRSLQFQELNALIWNGNNIVLLICLVHVGEDTNELCRYFKKSSKP